MRVVGKAEVIQLDEKSPMLRLARLALQRLLSPGRPAFTDSADPGVVNAHCSRSLWLESWAISSNRPQLVETERRTASVTGLW